jgi:hypothetical protein
MLALLLLPAAWSADQTLSYDVLLNGQPAGTRELTIQYFERPDGERRVVQLVSNLKLGSDAWHIRATGSSGPHGAAFTSSMDHNGDLSQDQGIQLPGGGWKVTVTDHSGNRASVFSATDARISSIDLFDPGRTWLLGTPGPYGILLAESGDAVGGQMADPQDLTVPIAGSPCSARHYALSGPGGNATFDVDQNGLLLRSEVMWLGMRVVSILHQAPDARTVDQVQTIDQMGSGVQETPL